MNYSPRQTQQETKWKAGNTEKRPKVNTISGQKYKKTKSN